jgi:hypothetical protein
MALKLLDFHQELLPGTIKIAFRSFINIFMLLYLPIIIIGDDLTSVWNVG